MPEKGQYKLIFEFSNIFNDLLYCIDLVDPDYHRLYFIYRNIHF
jgi:hypothetical protein